MSILQQTNVDDANADDLPAGASGSKGGPTVLEDVVDKATAKSELEQEINGMCVAVHGGRTGEPNPRQHSLLE